MTRIEAVRHLIIKYPAASHWMAVRFPEDRVLKDRLNDMNSMYRALVEGARLRASRIAAEIDTLKTRAGFKSATDEHVKLVRSA
ncbi:hypothetical protein EOW65_15795 [Sinirhodobacter ferrireducens]|uniref:Uncharacterized protein n=1 Tax=Paenirhodobacter ferrireducens TaxID=1215032 RepID=A0A443L971_9RHOB|nr:hypothetical protein [Sinirhodobacter ferrireducens]RWR45701.1 hypothetical protein EOW65_15795 [Sinirhodobacter ferrireducens]